MSDEDRILNASLVILNKECCEAEVAATIVEVESGRKTRCRPLRLTHQGRSLLDHGEFSYLLKLLAIGIA